MNVHYHVHKILPPLDRAPTLISAAHTIKFCLFNINFNIILPPTFLIISNLIESGHIIWTLYFDRHELNNECGIWGCLGGDCMQYCLLGYDVVHCGSTYSLSACLFALLFDPEDVASLPREMAFFKVIT
jgi:hypothetical protein